MKRQSLVRFTIFLILVLVMTGCGRIAGGDLPDGIAASSPDQAALSGDSTPTTDVPADAGGAAATGDLSGTTDTGTAGQMASEDAGAGSTESRDSGTDSANGGDADAATHVYRTVRVIAYNTAMMPALSGLLENDFGFGEWLPTLTFRYDTTTGRAQSASYTNYYPLYNMGIEDTIEAEKAALSADTELCRRFSNIRTEVMEDEELIALSFDIDISTYFSSLEPLINKCFLEGRQDIQRYKDMVYFDRLDNYLDPKPTCEEGDGFFYEKITCVRIEWED